MSDLEKYKYRIAITGGAGFIGSNLLLYLIPKYSDYLFINIDILTYAGNLSNLSSIENSPNYIFEKIDIRDYKSLESCFDRYKINGLIHLAAESHVDRSIIGPAEFVNTNINGTFNLLELAKKQKRELDEFRFHHVSTDEVFGSLDKIGLFTETTPYKPNSPYSASKAAGDHMVRAYYKTYDLNTVTTNCSNNFGPYQFPEKLIPLVIHNAVEGKQIPVYGDGGNIRDWLYVEDHCRAIDIAFHEGKAGATYNVGARNEITNIELVKKICLILNETIGGQPKESLITFIDDRPGQDRRYAIDPSLAEKELGWKSSFGFDESLKNTIDWYLNNKEWLKSCVSGEYLDYYEKVYLNR
jgi:dTDP-glucose 4,6-dehydratase